LTERERNRIFNLGYYTRVGQQGVSEEAFQARRDPGSDIMPAQAQEWLQ
jgi:hypothetical protein